MKTLTRRRFLTFVGLSGASLFAQKVPGRFVARAFALEAKEIRLTAAINVVDLGTGIPFKAWTYNGRVPGPQIRVTEGETLRVTLKNDLPEGTTTHWHGLPVPNRMDGVPYVTQEPVQPGQSFVYEFKASPPGTYLYHSHVSYQLDRGLYGSLIVEPKREPRGYDREYTLLLEDWATVDGGGPEAARMGRVQPRMGMMGGMTRGGRPGGPLLEPLYNAYTVNGKVFEASPPLMVRRGDRVRLRIGNPSASTIYTVRVAGHTLTVTHADGRPVLPVEVDAVRIGMGERYDVELYATNPGKWAIYNQRDGSPVSGWPLASLAYEGVTSRDYSGDSNARHRVGEYGMLEGLDEPYVKPVRNPPDRVFSMVLSGGMMSPYWTINGRVYPNSDDMRIRPGETVRLEYYNRSMMAHPMHLHGHFFEVVGSGLATGVRAKKDTLIIPAGRGWGALEFVADNPGVWFHHCHNLYHMEAGMANRARIL
jgi:FtsP/CotA-like multicopper oxidase with cupredoxin domain